MNAFAAPLSLSIERDVTKVNGTTRWIGGDDAGSEFEVVTLAVEVRITEWTRERVVER